MGNAEAARICLPGGGPDRGLLLGEVLDAAVGVGLGLLGRRRLLLLGLHLAGPCDLPI